MELYLNRAAVIIDLHERGFSEDFEVVGERIFWLQRKLLIKPKDLSLVEIHRFIGSDESEQFILAASLLSHFASGILMWQFRPNCDWRPAMINSKIKEMLLKVDDLDSHVDNMEFCKLHLQ